MASPREQADALSVSRARTTRVYQQPLPASAYRQPLHFPIVRRHHFHDVPPSPHYRHGDYIVVEGWGWWPRWFPYWDQRWITYWWYLYDYYGGDAYPEYAENARDAYLRQYAPQWGLVVSGWVGAEPSHAIAPVVRDHRGIVPTHGAPPAWPRDRHERPRYHHPHDYYGDYFVVGGAWWPRWFPYWDPRWISYWQQLYYYYGGDTYADYAQYARDAYLRAMAAQWGWI